MFFGKKIKFLQERLAQIELNQERMIAMMDSVRTEIGFVSQILMREGKIFAFDCKKCGKHFRSVEEQKVCNNCQSGAIMNGTGN